MRTPAPRSPTLRSACRLLLVLPAASAACAPTVVVREPVRTVYVAQPAPPPAVVEDHGPAPGPDLFWVHGHWAWENGRYAWKGGHWEHHRPAEVWVNGHWADQNGRWVFVPGHWQPAAPPPVVVAPPPPAPVVEEIIVQQAPPPPRVEVIPAPPSAEHVWVNGHWKWQGAWVWVPGHFEVRRVGHVWEPAHWQAGPGGFRFVPGHWRAQ